MPDKKKPLYRDAIEIVAAFAAAWVFLQGLGFALGTNMPIVSVVSESMFHTGMAFGDWWDAKAAYYTSRGIGRQDFVSFPFANGLAQGDMLVVIKPDNVNVGDVVIYQPQPGCFSVDKTIIHRITGTENGRYVTKGDNNAGHDPCLVSKEQVLGEAVAVAPLLGYPRILLFAFGI